MHRGTKHEKKALPARLDFTVVQYSATGNDYSSNNQLNFQDNVVKVNHIWESMCSVSGIDFLSFVNKMTISKSFKTVQHRKYCRLLQLSI